jgi:antitoxin component YwqK of YwqJK toxin-antitoxin module
MNKYFILIVAIFYTFLGIAQVDVFSDEIIRQNGLVLYLGKPLSGTVYSNDDKEIPNKCQCTLKESYSNGKLHGEKKEWFNNGLLKYSGKYIYGKADNIHMYYNKKGEIIKKNKYDNGIKLWSEIYNNNELSDKEIYQNNRLEHIDHYSKGKITGTTKVIDGITYKTEYYNNGKIKNETAQKNGINYGFWKYYSKNGKLIKIKNFYQGMIIEEGGYLNDNKNGKWISKSKDGKVETIRYYNNGKLMHTKIINSNHFVKNFPFKPDDKIISYFNEITGESIYYILRFSKTQPNYYQEIKNRITRYIMQRSKLEDDISLISDKELSNIIEISEINIEYIKKKYQRKKNINGVIKEYYEIGYEALIKFPIIVYDMDHKNPKYFHYNINPDNKLGKALLNITLSTYSKTKEEAYNKTLQAISTPEILALYFPITTTIKSIYSQTNTKINKIIINKGKSNGVYNKMKFAVFDNETKKFKAKLKVIKTTATNSICRVMEEKEWLKQYLTKNSSPWVKEISN